MGSKPRSAEDYVSRLVLEKQRAIYWLCSLLERDSTATRAGARRALARAVAVAEDQGPAAGLDLIERLALDDYLYLHSTRGELLRRAVGGDPQRDATEHVRADGRPTPEGVELPPRAVEGAMAAETIVN